MSTMNPVHRGTATSPCRFFKVKPSEIPVTLMNYRSPALCVPFQQLGWRLVWDHHFNNKKLKMPTTTLRAHIAMVTSSSTTPISSICLELRFPKRLPLAQHGSWQQPSAGSLLSLLLISSHLCEIQLCNWLSFSAGPWHKKKERKGEIMNSLSDRSFGNL